MSELQVSLQKHYNVFAHRVKYQFPCLHYLIIRIHGNTVLVLCTMRSLHIVCTPKMEYVNVKMHNMCLIRTGSEAEVYYVSLPTCKSISKTYRLLNTLEREKGREWKRERKMKKTAVVNIGKFFVLLSSQSWREQVRRKA